MDHATLAGRLAGHPLFEGFGPTELEALAARGRVAEFEPREALFRQGEPADSLCLVLDGEAVVLIRGERGFDHELARVESGSTLGELGLLGGGARAATVKAVEPMRCFLLPASELQGLLEAGDRGAVRLLGTLARTVAGRLRTMNERLAELADDQAHPDGTVRLKLSDIRERLLRAGTGGG